MSIATVASRALAGIDAPEVTVEVHLGPGLPAFHIVGLPDAEVREARDRVRAALNHARFEFPARRMTVNLAPAELPKDSSRFDLPIALGILAASGQLSTDSLAGLEFAGELSLTGELRGIRGALAMALSARGAGRAFVLPEANAPQAALAEGARILPARTLLEVVGHLAGEAHLSEYASCRTPAAPAYPDFAD
ncbi:MAG TPA: magnesium chelatase domain-containing protein, partial [Burkholderiales bacterium]|nr:magnesium chelatase domain-containing protein [Burkholderiales bacterium]